MVLKFLPIVFPIVTQKIPFSLVGKESGFSRHNHSQFRLDTMHGIHRFGGRREREREREREIIIIQQIEIYVYIG